MKVAKINMNGVKTVNAQKVESQNGAEYYAIAHGEEGRGRWQIRIPLAVREFPAPSDSGDTLPLTDEYKLVDLGRTDPRGNPLYLLALGEDDGIQLIFWLLDEGYRGHAVYQVEGKAEIIATGRVAQGAAGRMGGSDAPIVLVTGPCRLTWQRYGRLYGTESEWGADYDGKAWKVAPIHICAAEEAALNY
jgi:hypothetical protein